MSAVSLLLATMAVMAIFVTPAQATTGWPQDTTAVQNSYIQSTPDGSVVAANCSEATTAMRMFSSDGVMTADVPQRTDGSYTKSCYGQGAVGKDGTIFGIAENSYGKFAVVAYKGTTKLWEARFVHYCSNIRQNIERSINSMVVGTDGSLYVVTVANQCFNGQYLTKLNASTGQVSFERWVSSYAPTYLGATSKGLVSQDTAHVVRFIGYNNDFAAAITATGWVRAVDMNARTFTTDTSSDACFTSVLKMYTPGIAASFNFTVPQCWRIERAATSQNGLAILGYNQEGKPALTSYTPRTDGGFNAASVVLPDGDSYRSFKSAYGSYLSAYIQTDTNGNILLVREYQWHQGDNTLTGWQFTLQAANLNIVSEYDTDAFDFRQTSRFARAMNWAMAKDRLYISVGYCTSTDPYQCGTQSVTLYAVRLARLGVDYPRGAVLGVKATTPTCKNVTFVGVRGSGEDPFAYEGLGKTVQHVKDRLVAAGLTSMEVISVAYPATPVDYTSASYPVDYSNSVTAGVDSLAGVLAQINKDCPQSQVIVVGYSQGAQTTDAVRSLPTAIQNQIKAIVLFGDPLFNPALTSVNKGTYTNLYGVWVDPIGPGKLSPRQFASSMTGKVASYCLAGDSVCNLSPANVASCGKNAATCPHSQYAPNWTQRAATWVRSKVTP